MYHRLLKQKIQQHFYKGFAIVLIGPRQIGKTTLVQDLLLEAGNRGLFLNCDELDVKRSLELGTLAALKSIIGTYSLIVIDEAQRVENIGIIAKLLVDNFKEKQFIITGSSALEIADKIFEPLTGRQLQYQMYPLSMQEMYTGKSVLEIDRNIGWHLVYGCYPNVVNHRSDAEMIIKNLAGDYLYKDVLAWKDIRKPDLLDKILHLLALQMCSEVSLNELAVQLKISVATVDNYIDVLEKAGVLLRLQSYSTNERKEVTKMRKVYFWDNGIRNAILGRFDDVTNRTDAGALWENFLVAERLKNNSYHQSTAKAFFWRSKQQQEIDFVEVTQNSIAGYEFKLNVLAKGKPTKAFTNLYPHATAEIIHNENYTQFLNL
ncbi:MAG: ATP-binding protein [Bacteroidetes bacterium]|nr:MAG: ATP-binding protein [Bacteroidota bacterium]TAF93989.1 MAG: ATP-binding protein [Bacteroidota bacterium]